MRSKIPRSSIETDRGRSGPNLMTEPVVFGADDSVADDSVFVRAVRLALAEKGVPYRLSAAVSLMGAGPWLTGERFPCSPCSARRPSITATPSPVDEA